MPSSLTTNHSSALVYSTRSRVSVYGTGDYKVKLSGFSRRQGYVHYQRGPKALLYYQVRLSWRTSLPESASTPFNRLFRQPAEVPPLRPRVAMMASAGILTGCPSDAPPLQRVLVRPRLTLIRLALIRNPWPFGVGVSHPHCRYLCLHLLFRTLQTALRPSFYADRNAPLPII